MIVSPIVLPVARQAANAIAGGGESGLTLPTSAMHLWMFDEGAGDVAADAIGGLDIDLTAADNFSWTADGGRTTDGRIQTSSVTGFRSVAIAYKVQFSSAYSGAGYLIATGAGNVGITQTSCGAYENVYQTLGESYHQVMRRFPPDIGSQAFSLSSGGWTIGWLDYDTSKTGNLWFGGRGGAFVTSRVDVFDIAAAIVLDESIPNLIANGGMQQVEDYLCGKLKRRGIYIRNKDCPIQATGVLVIGESDVSGRGVLTDLTLAERTQVFTRTRIMSSIGASAGASTPATLAIGTNQMVTDGAYSAADNFGIELGIAAGYEAGAGEKILVISKTAKGSTFNAVIAANGANDPAAAASWDTSTTPYTLVLAGGAVREHHRNGAVSRLAGIGAPIKAVFNSLTKNDGKATNYVGGASNYLTLRQRLKEFILTWTGTPASQTLWIELGCPATFTGENATAVTDIRSALASWAAADSSVRIIDTDDYTLAGDGIHWTSQEIYDAGKAMVAQAAL